EAISHLLHYPDHYTSLSFQSINTTQLWLYVTKLQDTYDRINSVVDNRLRSQIISVPGGHTLLSAFDDYRLRGELLANYCLYDYRITIYKRKQRNGIHFSIDHPQHSTHSQFCRETENVTPCLIGTLLHLSANSPDANVREKFFCILIALFIPWYDNMQLKQAGDSWEDHFHNRSPHLSPRIRRYIFNIDLLHKSKEESQFDRMQREAHQPAFMDLDVMQEFEDDDNENDPSYESVLLPSA